MGSGQSSSHPPKRALHVLRVTPESPAATQTSIEPFFDFIVGYDGDYPSSSPQNAVIDAVDLEKIVESHEGRTLNLSVWSSKNRNTRVVPIIPSREWSQSSIGDINARPSLLGLSMRMCEPEFALDNVWHVLDVLEGSPAESAGLVPYGDYITGWSGGALSAENDFYDLVEAHIEKPLRVYVYSHDFDALREVVLVPNRHWGGEGLLGCVFGYGLLHRIPPQELGSRIDNTPPELGEDPGYEEQNLFIPADTEAHEMEYSAAQLAEWRMQEQENWQRENDAARNGISDRPTINVIPEEGDAMEVSTSREATPQRTFPRSDLIRSPNGSFNAAIGNTQSFESEEDDARTSVSDSQGSLTSVD